MTRSAFVFPLFVSLLWFSAGCASLSPKRVVGVSIVAIQPTRVTLLQSTAQLTLRLTNEGLEPLRLEGAKHRLWLNGKPMGHAVTNDAFTISPLGTVSDVSTLYLDNLKLLHKAAAASKSTGVVDYRLESELFTPGGSDDRSLRVTFTGYVDIRALLDATKPGGTK